MESAIQTWEPEEAHNEQTPSELTTSQQRVGEDESQGESSDTTLSIQISDEDEDDGGVEETKGATLAERREDNGNTGTDGQERTTEKGGGPAEPEGGVELQQPMPQRRRRDVYQNVDVETPRPKRGRTTRSSTSVPQDAVAEKEPREEDMEDACSEDGTYSSLAGSALSVCSPVDLFE